VTLPPGDIQMDVLLRVGHLQEQKLGDEDVRDVVVHRRADKNNPVNEQPRINIPTPFAAPGLLHDDRNVIILHG